VVNKYALIIEGPLNNSPVNENITDFYPNNKHTVLIPIIYHDNIVYVENNEKTLLSHSL